MEWIENEVIFNKLEEKSTNFFNKPGNKVCVSKNYVYCLFLQVNKAWYIENEGWRDSNSKPEKSNSKRLVLNFFKVDEEGEYWFKIFVPLKLSNCRLLTIDNNTFQLLSDTESIIGQFDAFDSLMWDFMTGEAESETEIEDKFKMIELK